MCTKDELVGSNLMTLPFVDIIVVRLESIAVQVIPLLLMVEKLVLVMSFMKRKLSTLTLSQREDTLQL